MRGNDDAALDCFFAGTFKNLSFGFGAGGEFFPRLLALDVFTGEQYIAFAVIYFENFNFDGIAHFVLGCGIQIGIVGELGARNISVGLVSDADADFAVNNLNDGARQNLTAVNLDDGLVDRLFVKYGIFLDVCCVCSCVFGCGFAIYISLTCSLIVLITSLIIESGVDAPATTPTIISLFLNISREISHSFAALRVFLQFFSQFF